MIRFLVFLFKIKMFFVVFDIIVNILILKWNEGRLNVILFVFVYYGYRI